jgi:uncharacterized protein YjcR
MSVFGDGMTYGVLVSDSRESIHRAEWLQEGWVSAAYERRKIRFLSPGKKRNTVPLVQEVWEKRARAGKKRGNAGAMENRSGLAPAANAAVQSLGFHYDAARFVEFASPFEAFFYRRMAVSECSPSHCSDPSGMHPGHFRKGERRYS